MTQKSAVKQEIAVKHKSAVKQKRISKKHFLSCCKALNLFCSKATATGVHRANFARRARDSGLLCSTMANWMGQEREREVEDGVHHSHLPRLLGEAL